MKIFTCLRSREIRSREIRSREVLPRASAFPCLREIPSRAAYFAGSTRICRTLSILATFIFFASASPSERELPRRSKDFALFIAVNDYQYWGKLKHPIREAEMIAGELYREFDFDTLILRNPTNSQIMSALRSYSSRTYPTDGQLLIYLSGHGDYDNITKEGFFIPRDAKLDDEFQASYFPYSRLTGIVGNTPCQHILLVIDACYAGSAAPSVAMRGKIEFGRPGTPVDNRAVFIERELQLRSRFLITSNLKELIPDASDFAEYFRYALSTSWEDDGIVTMQELQAQLIKAKIQPLFENFADHLAGGNFLFIKSKYIPSKTPATTTPSSPSSTSPPPTVPVDTKPKQDPCVLNQTGDVCVENGRGQYIWVNINGQVRQVPPGQKECFFDVSVGTLTFKVTNYKPGGGSYTLGGLTTHQARITACGTANSVIQ